MYSMVLMAALTTAVDMPDRGGRRGGGCCGCYGGGYGGGCMGYGGGWGGGCYGGGGWGGCYGGGWGGCGGGYAMGYGGGWGGGYGGRRAAYGGWGYGYSGYAAGNWYSPGFGTFAYSPMYSNWNTPIISGGTTFNQGGLVQNPYQGTFNQGFFNGSTMMNPASQSFYFNPAGGGNEATIIVHLPANASLSIDGQQTQQRSDRRVFTSPPLEPGKTYTYTLRAEMSRDGRNLTESRKVDVRAGQSSEVTINFDGSRNRRDEDNEPARGENRTPTPRTPPPPPPER